jgi:hypothetical protein
LDAQRYLSTLNILGKLYEFRLDHDVSSFGPTVPKLALKAIGNRALVSTINEFYTKKHQLDNKIEKEDNLENKSKCRPKTQKKRLKDKRSEYVNDPNLENCMVTDAVLEAIIRKVQFIPVIDVNSDVAGANARAPLYLDVSVDALQQNSCLLGLEIWMKPPFLLMNEFINFAERLFAEDPETRIVLVAPK